jgi:molybdopterin-binding protein
MKLSARNVLKGIVKKVDVGAVNVELLVEVASGVEITSIITKKSCENLELEVGKEAFIVVKASDVMVGVD